MTSGRRIPQTADAAVHMNGRIYDPLLGRFLSADIMVQNPGNLQCFNRYSYVQNNPLTLTDPTGWYSIMGLEFTDGGGVGGFFKDIGGYTADVVTGSASGAGNYAVGLAQGANAVATGTVNAVLDPVAAIHGAIQGTADTMGTLAGQIRYDPKGLANQVVSDLSDPKKLGQAVGNAVTGTATAAMTGQAAGAAKGALSEARLAEAAPKAEPTADVNPTEAPTTQAKNAASSLPEMKGMGATERTKTLTDAGFERTRVSNSAGKNETWNHADGSEARVHPYGNEKPTPYKSGNNAHMHKEDPAGNQLTDKGTVSTDKNETHIGQPNPKDFEDVRKRPNGS